MQADAKKLSLKSFQYLMEITYQRIEQNKEWDENYKPYSLTLINKLLEHFEQQEQYEKCAVIQKLKEKKLNHKDNYDIR